MQTQYKDEYIKIQPFDMIQEYTSPPTKWPQHLFLTNLPKKQGFSFNKGESKTRTISHVNKNPSPAQYDVKQIKVPKSQSKQNYMFKSPCKKNTNNNKKSNVGVGSYNTSIAPKKQQHAFLKAEPYRFIQKSQYMGIQTPGPGYYKPQQKTIQRHRSLSHFMRSVSRNVDTQKGQIGPGTYELVRSKSVHCAVKMSNLATRGEKFAIKGAKTTPCSYLKIDEWCQYFKNKPVKNNLQLMSKGPTQGIYH